MKEQVNLNCFFSHEVILMLNLKMKLHTLTPHSALQIKKKTTRKFNRVEVLLHARAGGKEGRGPLPLERLAESK